MATTGLAVRSIGQIVSLMLIYDYDLQHRRGLHAYPTTSGNRAVLPNMVLNAHCRRDRCPTGL